MLPAMADGRARAGVLLFVDGRLAVIDRVRPGGGRYQVLPGGGIDPGETAREAAVREAWEETGLRVELTSQPALRFDTARGVEWVFHATAVGGTFGSGDGVDLAGRKGGRGTYQAILLARTELAGMNLVPPPVAEAVRLHCGPRRRVRLVTRVRTPRRPPECRG
jgi:8-oxo-dGTP diphosphatase